IARICRSSSTTRTCRRRADPPGTSGCFESDGVALPPMFRVDTVRVVTCALPAAEQISYVGPQHGTCHQVRERATTQVSGGGGGGARRASREMFTATCSECGQEAQVPFQPSADKPVYCSTCFEKRRGAADRSGGGRYGGRSRY